MKDDTTGSIRAIDDLLDELLGLEPGLREPRLARLRATDAVLAREVERLLALCLEEPVGLAPGGALEGAVARECLLGVEDGDSLPSRYTLGPYILERLLGRGGMSEVHLATRRFEGFSQQVALKVVRSDRVSETLKQRLVAEQRTLARLDHPNIARFLDAGVGPQGNVYLAMELVDGAPILAHAAATATDLRTRISWAVQLCGALEHAHAQLVVHCDIKPSNVLVDRRGQARLLDFGISRVLGESDDPSDTGIKLFTPDCAAPEQVLGAPVGTATDVFQVGALLYQLVAGTPWPRDDGVTSLGRVDAILHEVPVPPSTRLADAGHPALARQVRGDLDAVVLRCLEKDAARRYPSIERVHADLQAWLQSRPVAAATPSRWRRVRLWLRRNRRTAGVAAAGTAALALVATVSVLQIREERDLKARELERAQAVEGFMGQVFREASPYLRGDQENALATLSRVGHSMLAGDQSMDPRTRFSLMSVLATLEMDMGRPELAELRARQALQDAQAAGVQDAATRLATTRLLADALSRQDRDGEALDVLAAELERSHGTGLSTTVIAQSRAQLGELYATVGRMDESTREFDAVYDALVATGAPLDAASVDALRRLGRHLNLAQEGENPAKVLAIAHRLGTAIQGETPIQRAARLSTLSLVSSLASEDPAQSGRYGREAALVLAEALGDAHPRVSVAWSDACIAFLSGGELLEAREACEAALAVNLRAGQEDSTSAAADRINLAMIEYLRGNFATAATMAREAMAVVDRESALGLYLFGAQLQAQADHRLGGHASALALLDDMAAIQREQFPDNADLRLSVHSLRAEVLLAQGRTMEAAGAIEAAGMRQATGGPIDRINAAHQLVLAAHDAATGRRQSAVDTVAAGIRALESHPAMSPAELSWGLLRGGEVLLRAGDSDGAANLFARALDSSIDAGEIPGMWAWAALRREQLRPGSVGADALQRASAIAIEQFGSSPARVPCLVPPTRNAAPTACP